MESKKDIGKFFRENLDQLNVAPSAMAWEGIEKDLKEKKKKRRFLIWFFIVAFVGGSISTYTVLTFNHFTNSNPTKENKSVPSGKNTNSSSIIAIDSNRNKNDNTKNTQNSLVSESFSKNESNINSSNNTNSVTSNNSISPSTRNDHKIDKKQSLKNKKSESLSTDYIAKNGKKQKKSITKNSSSTENDNRAYTNNSSKTEIGKTPLISEETTSEVNAEKSLTQTTIDSLNKKNNIVSEKEKSLTEIKKDSTSEQPQKEDNFGVVIAPYYGYSYSGKFGSGNTLSEKFNVTDENGKLSQNFGILVRWMGTEKLGIQTGIGQVQLRRFTEVEKNNSLFAYANNINTENPMQSYETIFANDNKVTFHEEITYIEVPLEAYYSWSKNKIGLASSFGISIYFLNKNDVYLESENVSKFRVGSHNNITSQCFSANAKLNLFYKLSKRIQLDLYPEFQFQFMRYKDTSNYYPYYLSLKAGISYKL